MFNNLRLFNHTVSTVRGVIVPHWEDVGEHLKNLGIFLWPVFKVLRGRNYLKILFKLQKLVSRIIWDDGDE